MDWKPHVVIGEAPESDSEEEINVPTVLKTTAASNPKGTIIEGEAPESDEEHDDDGGSVSSAASVASMPSLASVPKKKSAKRNERLKYNTLLHKRLRERNISLRANIYGHTRQLIADNEKELNSLDQQLLRSQGVLQESVATLRAMQGELMQLYSKLAAVTSGTFLPRINNV